RKRARPQGPDLLDVRMGGEQRGDTALVRRRAGLESVRGSEEEQERDADHHERVTAHARPSGARRRIYGPLPPDGKPGSPCGTRLTGMLGKMPDERGGGFR